MARSTQSTYSFSTSAKTSGGSFLGGNLGSSSLGSSSLGSSSLGSSSLGRTSTPTKKDAKEPVIKNIDMDDDTKDRAIETVKEAMEKFETEKDRASYIKKAFDVEFDTTWHVVVGKHFASFVTHESKCFIYFYIGPIAFLLWKSG